MPDGYLTHTEALAQLTEVTTRKAALGMLRSAQSRRIPDPDHAHQWLYPAEVIEKTCALLGG